MAMRRDQVIVYYSAVLDNEMQLFAYRGAVDCAILPHTFRARHDLIAFVQFLYPNSKCGHQVVSSCLETLGISCAAEHPLMTLKIWGADMIRREISHTIVIIDAAIISMLAQTLVLQLSPRL